MSIVKSFSVSDGDMFYIYHDSHNFTVIDCCYDPSDEDKNEKNFREISRLSRSRSDQVNRFISTHPDQDHIRGLRELNSQFMHIENFYCVKNKAVKDGDKETDDFKKYCTLRDSKNAFYLTKGFKRKWINEGDEERGSSEIHCLWPDTDNDDFKKVLEDTSNGRNFNNLSPILTYNYYNISDRWTFMWMGDMEADFRDKIEDEVDWPKVNVLFAPHHGRKSGHVSKSILQKINPDVIIIGEAKSENLDYYNGYNTITQNLAGDIVFDCDDTSIDIYVGNPNYKIKKNFLCNYMLQYPDLGYYLGSIEK